MPSAAAVRGDDAHRWSDGRSVDARGRAPNGRGGRSCRKRVAVRLRLYATFYTIVIAKRCSMVVGVVSQAGMLPTEEALLDDPGAASGV